MWAYELHLCFSVSQEQQRIQSLLRTYQAKKSVGAQEQQPPAADEQMVNMCVLRRIAPS